MSMSEYIYLRLELKKELSHLKEAKPQHILD